MILKNNEQQLLNQLKETLGNYKSDVEVDSVWKNVESTLDTNKKSQSGFFTQAFFLKVITGLMIFITGMLFYLNFDLAKQIDKRKKVADLLNSPSDVTELVVAYPQEKGIVKQDNTKTIATVVKEESIEQIIVEEKKFETKKLRTKKSNSQLTTNDSEKVLTPTVDSAVIEEKSSEGNTQQNLTDSKIVEPSSEVLVPTENSEATKEENKTEESKIENPSKEQKIKKGSSNPFKKGKRYNIPLKKEKK